MRRLAIIVTLAVAVIVSGSICTPTNWIENFDLAVGSTDSFFNNVGCQDSKALTQTNGILHLQLETKPTCTSGSEVRSKDSFASGYTEAKIRIGGQGSGFIGVVYTFITQSDPTSDPIPDEIDWEILGRAEYAGIGQTNWYHDGSKLGINAKNETVSGMSNQGWFILSVDWDTEQVVWAVNGETVRTATGTNMTKPQYLWASLWDGSAQFDWAGIINWNSSNTAISDFWLEVDYIKYLANSVDPVFTLCAPVNGGSGGGSDGTGSSNSGSTSGSNGTSGVSIMLWTILMTIMAVMFNLVSNN